MVVVAAGLAAAFGVGDGTRCGAALCHSFARFVLALRRKSYHARLVDPRLKLHTKIILRNLKTRYRWFSKEGLKFGTTTQIRPWNNSVWLFCVMFISSGDMSGCKCRLVIDVEYWSKNDDQYNVVMNLHAIALYQDILVRHILF